MHTPPFEAAVMHMKLYVVLSKLASTDVSAEFACIVGQ